MGLFDFLSGGSAQAATQPQATPVSAPAALPAIPMGAQLNGLPQEAQSAPPQTPEEYEAKKSQWAGFLERVKTDPNMQLAIIRLGTNMMQPVAPGQTGGGHLGRSLDDSIQYLSGLREAETQGKRADRKLELDERRGAADVASTQATTKATEQGTSQQAQMFPNKLKALGLELKQLEAKEGLWTPEEERKVHDLKKQKLQAEIDQASAHSRMYDSVAGTGAAKGRTAKSMQMDDGTVLTTTSTPTGTYYSRFVPPKYNSIEEAQAAATKVVDKQTPWIFGKPAYQGTKEQEVARLTKLWTEPKVEHYDSNLQPVKTLPTDPMGTPGAKSTSPSDFPKVSAEEQNARDVEAGKIRAGERTPEELRKSVQDLQAELKRKDLTGSAKSILKRELELTERALNGGEKPETTPATPSAPAGATVVKVERGPDGKLAIPSASAPVTPAPKTDTSQEALLAYGKEIGPKPVSDRVATRGARSLQAKELTPEKISSLSKSEARALYNDLNTNLTSSQRRALQAKFS